MECRDIFQDTARSVSFVSFAPTRLRRKLPESVSKGPFNCPNLKGSRPEWGAIKITANLGGYFGRRQGTGGVPEGAFLGVDIDININV